MWTEIMAHGSLCADAPPVHGSAMRVLGGRAATTVSAGGTMATGKKKRPAGSCCAGKCCIAGPRRCQDRLMPSQAPLEGVLGSMGLAWSQAGICALEKRAQDKLRWKSSERVGTAQKGPEPGYQLPCKIFRRACGQAGPRTVSVRVGCPKNDVNFGLFLFPVPRRAEGAVVSALGNGQWLRRAKGLSHCHGDHDRRVLGGCNGAARRSFPTKLTRGCFCCLQSRRPCGRTRHRQKAPRAATAGKGCPLTPDTGTQGLRKVYTSTCPTPSRAVGCVGGGRHAN